MMKVTATPTWQWSSNNSRVQSGDGRTITVRTSPPDVKRYLLPRSLDISFDLKYRR
jgi:hypothetical protein